MTLEAPSPAPRRRGWRRLAWNYGSGIALVVAAELGLTAVGFEYRPISIEEVGPGAEVSATDDPLENVIQFNSSQFRYHPEMLWEPRPGRALFNRQGFRGSLVRADGARSAPLVFAVGDSNTLGDANRPHWPAVLERFLDSSSHETTVVNAGVSGHTSQQGLARLRQTLEYAPDVVLISFGGNDPHRAALSDRAFATPPTELELALARFRLYQFYRRAWDTQRQRRAREEDRGLVPRVSLEEYRENLEAMIALCRDAGATPVLLTRPFVGKPSSDDSWKAFAPAYNDVVRGFAGRADVHVFDVHRAFADQYVHFRGESHFSESGVQRMARLLGEFLLDEVEPLSRDSD